MSVSETLEQPTRLKILVVGSGGREHALVWKLSQEAEVFCTPGNAGIAEDCETFGIPASDPDSLMTLARELNIDLVVIGPEDPLIAGLADELRSAGLTVFGPGKSGAQHEASKAWSKQMMVEAGVPTSEARVFTELQPAIEYVRTRVTGGRQVVVKASGAALGKGVIVCSSLEEAELALVSILERRELGDAGSTVVVEDRIEGHEFSLLTLVSGKRMFSLPVARDYKRISDGDKGPNTGGMGSYSPVEWVTKDLVLETEKKVVRPMVDLMAKKGIDYRGVLFSGLMFDGEQVSCLEYNVRFGDPETQSVLSRLGEGFADALHAVANGLPITPVQILDDAVVTVVMASGGYPGSYEKSKPISIGDVGSRVKVFHSGTARRSGAVVTNGGRVLGITASGSSVEQARLSAYGAIKKISFEGAQFRSDIAVE